MSGAVVELRDVFSVHRTNEGDAAALAGTNLELACGEVLCVLGPSGAGKSTLLRVVAGIQPPSAGVVRVLGRDIGRMPARSRSRLRHELIGFLGQYTETVLSPDQRMRDAVALPLVLRGMPRRERRARVDELLQATGLADRADAFAGEEALVISDGWLRLPSDLLTQAGIWRRARVRPTPDGVIVTRAVSDSGPAEAVPAQVEGTGPQPTARWSPVRVELRTVALSYGHGPTRRQVLSGFTHDFAPGRVTAITGRSGVGKTTLLKLVAGLDRPSSGQVMVDGHSLGDCDADRLASLRRELIGYLSQEPAPIEFLSAEENAVLILRIRGWEADAAAGRAAEALTRAGLADRTRQRVHRLSAGEAQRLALARALASARGLLIVDEPTSRQDENNARAVAALLAAAAHDEGQTVICATHDPAVIREADKVVRLAGQLGP